MTPLEVDVVVADAARQEVADALAVASHRLNYRLVPPQRVSKLVARWRRHPPDVVLVVGEERAALIAAWLSGIRCAWLPCGGSALGPLALIPVAMLEPGDLAQLGPCLAAAAARPGAGLEPAHAASVVVTVLNEGTAVDALLESLLPQLDPQDEIVVVDGGSTDDTAQRVRVTSERDPRVRLIECPGANIPAGRNVGIAAATNDLICCTDAGCLPSATWLRALKAAFADADGPLLVTGLYDVVAETPLEEAMAVGCYPVTAEARRPGPLVRAYGAAFGRVFDPTLPTGRSVAFSREAWAAAGGFPESLDTGEDVAFGRAVAASGSRCVLSVDAVVEWRQRPSLAKTSQMYFRYGVGGARSGDAVVLGRDIARAAAIVAAPAMLACGGPFVRRLVLGGCAAYLSLPLARALRGQRPLAVTVLTPAAIAIKDVSKAAGCMAGLLSDGPADAGVRARSSGVGSTSPGE